MVVTEEIDAIRVMGLDPVEFTLAPKYLGALITLPCLTILSTLCGIFAGYLFLALSMDMSLRVYYDYDFNLWALTSGKKFFHTGVLLAVLGCGGHSDRPKWKNYREDMRARARYVKGLSLFATNVVAVIRFLYKVAWFRLLRSI